MVVQMMVENLLFRSVPKAKRIPNSAIAGRLTIVAQKKPSKGLSTKKPPDGVRVK